MDGVNSLSLPIIPPNFVVRTGGNGTIIGIPGIIDLIVKAAHRRVKNAGLPASLEKLRDEYSIIK